jgi:hypothetical protein
VDGPPVLSLRMPTCRDEAISVAYEIAAGFALAMTQRSEGGVQPLACYTVRHVAEGLVPSSQLLDGVGCNNLSVIREARPTGQK